LIREHFTNGLLCLFFGECDPIRMMKTSRNGIEFGRGNLFYWADSDLATHETDIEFGTWHQMAGFKIPFWDGNLSLGRKLYSFHGFNCELVGIKGIL